MELLNDCMMIVEAQQLAKARHGEKEAVWQRIFQNLRSGGYNRDSSVKAMFTGDNFTIRSCVNRLVACIDMDE